jgi:uncharacterized protein (DUF1499 family)
MKIALIILAFAIVAFIILFFILGVISKSGRAPALVGGMLSKCPNRPNCVCSEQTDDINHYIDPIIIPQDITFDTLPILKSVILGMGGTINAERENYIASTFSSLIFGFVDDFELRIDSIQKVIHMRSASRVGYSDSGVNKKRTELFKKLYNKKVSEATQSLNATPKNSAY